jgi:hypothetical protein
MKNSNEKYIKRKILTYEDISKAILRSIWHQINPCLIDTIIVNIPEIKGTCEWPADPYFNTFYTRNISILGLNYMQNLLQAKQIHMWHEDIFQCRYEGHFPYGRNIVNPNRKIPHKEPRWQPAVMVITTRGIDRLIG